MFSVLIFKTIQFRPKPFHITVAELRQMKSAVWLPGARRDCQAFVIGRTKVVVQSVCSHTHIQALPGRRLHIRCDGALE